MGSLIGLGGHMVDRSDRAPHDFKLLSDNISKTGSSRCLSLNGATTFSVW